MRYSNKKALVQDEITVNKTTEDEQESCYLIIMSLRVWAI